MNVTGVCCLRSANIPIQGTYIQYTANANEDDVVLFLGKNFLRPLFTSSGLFFRTHPNSIEIDIVRNSNYLIKSGSSIYAMNENTFMALYRTE